MTAAGPSALHDVDRVDRRGRAWRRRQTRRAELVEALGGEGKLTVHQKALIELALGIGALVDDMAARLAAGEMIDAERYVSAIKEQRRIVNELRLPRGGAPARPTLQEHLANRAAERAAASAEGGAT
jgi:hypothetical protein